MRQRQVSFDTNEWLGAWWLGSIGLGAMLALGYPALIEVGRVLLLCGAVCGCALAPVAGVWATRQFFRHAAKKRKPRLRGAEYADYAYIL